MLETVERFVMPPTSPYTVYHNGKVESIDKTDSVKP